MGPLWNVIATDLDIFAYKTTRYVSDWEQAKSFANHSFDVTQFGWRMNGRHDLFIERMTG